MSRRDFRGAVSLPRPRAAVALVTIALLSIAISGQMQPLALGVACTAIAFALARSERPAGWQHSAWILNGALAGAVAFGLALWLRGDDALVALAHFSLIAQGLQLLDARPRRSEFVLVALALFQMTLAASLTDSALFPPLLVAFTVAAVWTLLVHTLRAEAIEADEPEAARRVMTRGLLRTTVVASLASVGVAVLLFPFLPRIRSGAIFDASFGRGVVTSGFSDRVELGDIGRIRLDPSLVLRVESGDAAALPADERYWRGLAFDHFDGRSWSVTQLPHERIFGDPEIGVDLGVRHRGHRLVQEVTREEISPGVLFSAGTASLVRGGLGPLERDANGSLFAHASADKRVLYSLISYVEPPEDAKLALDRATPPAGGERYLQLPALDARVGELVRSVVAGAASDAERVRRIEAHLRSVGRYTDTPPPLHAGSSPVEQFLLARSEGHCEYFASAMVTLLRSVGLPARLVNGFAGGHENALGGFIELAQSDAHSWVEVHYARAGWVGYDPTPPDARLAGADALRGFSQLGELASAAELWWFRNVVDFDRGHQARALRSLWHRWHQWRAGQRDAERAAPGAPAEPLGLPSWGWSLAVFALLLGVVAADLRRRRQRAGALPPAYRAALGLLRRRGITRSAATSARAFAEAASAQLPAAGAAAFRALSESYLRERFAREPSRSASAELAALRDSLRG